jgi:hypothetical protein
MGEPIEHGRIARVYERVNGVNLRFVSQPFRQLLGQILRFALSRIDVLFPSFGIYGIVGLQSSPIIAIDLLD